MRYKSASFVMGNLDILIVFVDLGLPSFQGFFFLINLFILNTKYFNTQGIGKKDFKEIDSDAYLKKPNSWQFQFIDNFFFIILDFLASILINLEGCILVISMDQGYFEALGIFRSFYKGILAILEVSIVFGKFSRLVFWSFQQFGDILIILKVSRGIFEYYLFEKRDTLLVLSTSH